MNILDDVKNFFKFQQSKVPESISRLPVQIFEGWEKAGELKLSTRKSFENIVVVGMGGSNLASEIVRSIWAPELKLPLILVRSGRLPGFVNRRSLVVVSSYSGNTAETLGCFSEARSRQAKIICLAGGGQLAVLAKRNGISLVDLKSKNNPCGQPRYGLGLQLGALLGIFKKIKVINLTKVRFNRALEQAKIANSLFNPEISSRKNLAKLFASRLAGFLSVVVAGDFLSGNARVIQNQLNESAKNFAFGKYLPEINHHLLEGLSFPKPVARQTKFFFLSSNQYPAELGRRVEATEKVLKKQKIKALEYSAEGDDRLAIALEVLLFGSWLSFYLAILNNQNPAAVPWVDFLKKELKRRV